MTGGTMTGKATGGRMAGGRAAGDAVVAAPGRRGRGRLVGWGLAAAVLAVFAGANAHLVAVAVGSQPDCVPHLDHPTEGAGGFRAATSSC